MVSLADSLVSSSSRQLPLRMRPDLSIRYHRYQGLPYWVIKEPVGLKYYRFQEEEYSILRMLDGNCSFDDIKERFEREYAPQKISLSDLQHFIGMLHRSGLLITDAERQGPQLRKRRDETARRELFQKLSNILAIRFKGVDPDKLLNWLAPYTNWFFTKWTAMFFGMVALSALLLVGVNYDEFRTRLPAFHEFFGPENWIWLGCTLAITKVLHEFGHGLSCKKFGGECHEIGVMILVLTPCLYCNVSDSWLLPNKWHRAVIGAAGMYVEIVLASIATFLWWYSEPDLLINNICLSVMFICSVSTILFNGNPLLRFDGYYILSDVSEIPNLRQKASKIMTRYMQEYCLGIEQQEDPFLPQRNQWFFATYTVAAVAYRWVVVISIMMFLNQILEPYGLKVIGQLIAFTGIVGMLVQPLWQTIKFFRVPGRVHQVKKKNLSITLAVVGALIAAFVYVPFPYSVKCALEVQPRDDSVVYALVPGTLQEVKVKAGDSVDEDQEVAVMTNVDLLMSVRNLEIEVEQYKSQIEQASRAGNMQRDYESAARIPELQELLVSAEAQLARQRADLDKLRVKSPAAGVVMPAPNKKQQPTMDGELPGWSGSLLDAENAGAFLQQSDAICRIGEPGAYEALLAVDQSDVVSIKPGQLVRIKLDSHADEVFETTIQQNVSKEPMEFVPPSMTVQAGGKIPVRPDSIGGSRPLSATYQVAVELPAVPGDIGVFRVGQRGWAKVSADPKSLGQRLWRLITRTFRFDL
ncbi:MAG: hemolysin D [Planctomycetaceae bacterium]|nr:hemolysin D [Planctomycetaceae bacterium]